MKQALLNLEVFDLGQMDAQGPLLDRFQAEKLREQAYEQGYAAGWQDALEHMRNEDELRNIAAQEALQAICFSYNEAHQALVGSFLALTHAMLEKLLPEAAHLALPAFLSAELASVVAQNTHAEIQLVCAPCARDRLAEVVASCTQIKIELIEEPSFSESQLSLRLDSQEREIDLSGLLQRMREMFAQHHSKYIEQETAYGRA
ncbi:hypothetical protein [Roseinatronobacter sp.]|uniref:hypothetical protein n=1 Tax=Roseinatronobacter sp. TaxID=1945755 RepID=UPI0025EB624D|nr:hypothetical protein [Rhodobaca sp.]